MSNIYYHGPASDWCAQLAARLGGEVKSALPASPADDDLIFLAVRTDASAAAALTGSNAFATCRALKSQSRARVFLITDAGDAYSPEIARFCLADGCVEVGADGALGDLSVVEVGVQAARQRTPVDELLASLESELASDAGRQASVIHDILCGSRDESIVDQLTDSATGLFAAPFANFKLEEEFKRAQRFHQPLSLALLDIGGTSDDPLPEAAGARDRYLAEVAGVFLNECRDIDVLARFTETTFLFLLPGTGAAGASVLVGRMLEELGKRSLGGADGQTPRAGLATVPAAGIVDRSEFLARAEACLRLAQEGRGVDGMCVSCE